MLSCMYACVYVCNVCMHARMYDVCMMYVCMYACMHACMHVYIEYIETHAVGHVPCKAKETYCKAKETYCKTKETYAVGHVPADHPRMIFCSSIWYNSWPLGGIGFKNAVPHTCIYVYIMYLLHTFITYTLCRIHVYTYILCIYYIHTHIYNIYTYIHRTKPQQ